MKRPQGRSVRRLCAFLMLLGAMGAVVTVDTGTAEEQSTERRISVGRTFVGKLEGAPVDARIAVVIDGSDVTAYVCSGNDEFNQTHSRWLRGTLDSGSAALAVDGLKAAIKVDGGKVTGTLTGAQEFKFTATAVDNDGNAGLYRAGGDFAEGTYVVGWIIDQDEAVVGTGGRLGAAKGKVNTLQPPKGTGNLAAKIGNKVNLPQKVGGTKNGTAVAGKTDAKGTAAGAAAAAAQGKKLTAELQAENLNDAVAEAQADGGNLGTALVVNQVRRFLSGQRPANALETKTFARLAAAPRADLQQYIADWDRLPANTKNAILGEGGRTLGNNALTAEAVRGLVTRSPRIRAGTPRSAAPVTGTVNEVSLGRVTCVDETNPEAVGSDEIFAIHTTILGSGAPVTKQTKILKPFDDGAIRDFDATDKIAFPLNGQTPAANTEVFIVTTLYEDDGEDIAKVLNLLKPLIEVAVIAIVDSLTGKQEDGSNTKLSDIQKAGIKIAVAGALKGVEAGLGRLLLQTLGTDSIVVLPNGSIVSEAAQGGGPKTKMTFRKVKNGNVRFQYELSQFSTK